jgi:hypothetical protein
MLVLLASPEETPTEQQFILVSLASFELAINACTDDHKFITCRTAVLDVRIIFRRIFGKWDVGVWTGLGWLRIGTGGGRL